MPNPHLKLFSSCESSTTGSHRREQELDQISGTAKAKTMSVPFGTLVQFLSHAIENDSAWLEDFAEDTVHIDADLHQVILAYQNMRSAKAA